MAESLSPFRARPAMVWTEPETAEQILETMAQGWKRIGDESGVEEEILSMGGDAERLRQALLAVLRVSKTMLPLDARNVQEATVVALTKDAN